MLKDVRLCGRQSWSLALLRAWHRHAWSREGVREIDLVLTVRELYGKVLLWHTAVCWR